LHLFRISGILLLPNIRLASSPSRKIKSLHARMDHTQLSCDAQDRAPPYTPESFTRRQRLQAIAAGGENLYEPPNTAEAFARLEAAIDEVKLHGILSERKGPNARRQHLKDIIATSRDLYEPPDTAEAFARLEAAMDEVKRHALATGNDSGQDRMLDPPTTAERFNRIETAVDEVFARTNVAAETPRQATRSKSDPLLSTQGAGSDHKETAHLLRKRQLRFADQSEPARKSGLLGSAHRSVRPRSGIYNLSDAYKSAAGKARITTQSLVELLIPEAERAKPCHDEDVFRDDDAVEAFANQTYQSAREKHF